MAGMICANISRSMSATPLSRITPHVTHRLMRMTRPIKRENDQSFAQWANANALQQIASNRLNGVAPGLLVYVAVMSPPQHFEQASH